MKRPALDSMVIEMCSNEAHLLELIGHALKSLRSNTKQQRYIGQKKFYYHQSTIRGHKKKKEMNWGWEF